MRNRKLATGVQLYLYFYSNKRKLGWQKIKVAVLKLGHHIEQHTSTSSMSDMSGSDLGETEPSLVLESQTTIRVWRE